MSTKEKAKALMSRGWKGAKEKTRAARGVLSHLAKHKRFKLPTATRDAEYEAASRAFLETVTVLEKARGDLNTFLGAVRSACRRVPPGAPPQDPRDPPSQPCASPSPSWGRTLCRWPLERTRTP